MNGNLGVRERLARRRRQYHCKACGDWFPRRLPNCPACKVRKGGRGQRLGSMGWS
jgi:hypothetical protein